MSDETLCTHHIEGANSAGVFRCECGSVYYTHCSRCLRVVKPDTNAALFESSYSYRLRCATCFEIFCLDCANCLLDASGGARLLCFACRAGGQLAHNDEAASGFVISYHCSYIDRNGRVCSHVSMHPTLFATRDAARQACIAYVPTVLNDRAEPELIEQSCRHLHSNFSQNEVVDIMLKTPGFTVRAEIQTALGPGLHVLVVCKPVRACDKTFQFEMNS